MKRQSPLSNKETVLMAVENSKSTREVLEKLGLRSAGGNYSALKKACQKFGIERPIGSGHMKTEAARSKTLIPLEQVLVENSSYNNRGSLKSRCYQAGLLVEKCYDCGTGSKWNGKSLTLQLEHINGVWNDNRIENLSILCPNCHSQTSTFAGRSH